MRGVIPGRSPTRRSRGAPVQMVGVVGSPFEGSGSEEATGVSSGTPNRHDGGTYTLTVKVVDKKIKAKHQHVTQNTATSCCRLPSPESAPWSSLSRMVALPRPR